MSTEDDDGSAIFGFDSVDWDDADALDSDEEEFQNAQEPAQSPEKVAEALMERRLYRIGWLKKQGGGRAAERGRHAGSVFSRKNWKIRWFVLRDTILKYYKHQTITGREQALGWINIRADDVRIDTDPSNDCRFEIITKERTYMLVAATREEAAAWVSDLIDALNRSELDTL
eukprot:m.14631 g.14631  ORF g.14631 m.14631 type:complete len:172 (+) comp10322_c0_seq1:464-979(+)